MIRIPDPVNAVAGKAWYEHGVITVTFPRMKDGVVRLGIEDKEE